MDGKEHQDYDGFNTLICQDDLYSSESPTYHQSMKARQQAFMASLGPGRLCRLAAVILALLAAVLLIVDISLGVHYNDLADTHFTDADVESIGKELVKLQDTYKTAIDTMKDARKKVDGEMSGQKQTNWEFEHQSQRIKKYEEQIDRLTKDVAKLRAHLPMMDAGCKRCPPGWILMNSVCYYFPISDTTKKTWQNARGFCQMSGGDLAIIDSKDEQNSTVNYLITHQDPSAFRVGFWIGLTDIEEERMWKWVDGKLLVEGYWGNEDQDDLNMRDCAAVYAFENLFQAWEQSNCAAQLKWICEKAPTSVS